MCRAIVVMRPSVDWMNRGGQYLFVLTIAQIKGWSFTSPDANER